MRQEQVVATSICLAVATVIIGYLLIFGLPAPSVETNGPSTPSDEETTQPATEPSGEGIVLPTAMVLSYDIGGCDSHGEKGDSPSRGLDEGIAITATNNTINIAHALNYVCCAEIKLEMETNESEDNDTLIVLTERNVGQMCKCICDYSVNGSVGPLAPGSYDVQLWGVAFEDTEPGLLFEKEIEIG